MNEKRRDREELGSVESFRKKMATAMRGRWKLASDCEYGKSAKVPQCKVPKVGMLVAGMGVGCTVAWEKRWLHSIFALVSFNTTLKARLRRGEVMRGNAKMKGAGPRSIRTRRSGSD